MKLAHGMGRILVWALLALAPGLWAAEVAGVRFDATVRVAGQDLVLNGAGVRSRLFVKVYVGALYVSEKSSGAATLIESRAPRRMSLALLRDIDASTLSGALEDGLRHNSSPAERAATRGAADELTALMRAAGPLRQGDRVTIDCTAEGVSLGLNGALRGKVMDPAFARLLLRVWLGDKPVDASLKKALLGS